MSKKINLELDTPQNREMRLGSIIAWDGSASELVEESDYSKRSCAGKCGNHADYASLVYHFSRAVCVHSKLQLVRQAILRIVYLYIIRLSDVQEEVRYMNRHSAED